VTLYNFSCIQDVGLSKDLNESFRKHLGNTGDTLDVDFSIQVSSVADPDPGWVKIRIRIPDPDPG
jgi:hypothetical protein